MKIWSRVSYNEVKKDTPMYYIYGSLVLSMWQIPRDTDLLWRNPLEIIIGLLSGRRVGLAAVAHRQRNSRSQL